MRPQATLYVMHPRTRRRAAALSAAAMPSEVYECPLRGAVAEGPRPTNDKKSGYVDVA